MTILKILKYPNKALITKTTSWDFEKDNSSSLKEMIENMHDSLKEKSDGVALAANQIGYDKRIFVLTSELAAKHNIENVIINPTIVRFDKDEELIEDKEGCLSFPGLYFKIKRYDKLVCSFKDISGNYRVAYLDGFISRVFQHECEHLDGKLYVSNLPKRQMYQVLGAYRKSR